MASYNKSTFTGNLGGDAETRVVGDTTVTTFSVAVNPRKTKDGTQPPAMWVRCSYWGDRGKAVEPYLKTGTFVLIDGEVKLETWEAKGEKSGGAAIGLRINELSLLGGKDDANSAAPKKAASKNDDFGDLEDEDELPF